MAMNLFVMPTLHVGQGTHLGGLSVFPVWTDAPVVSGLDTGGTARVHLADRHLPGLLEAAAIDAALLPAEPTPGRRARRFVGALAKAPLGDELGADAGAGHALPPRWPHHEIRGLGWDDRLLHATVFNRRHHLMQVA